MGRLLNFSLRAREGDFMLSQGSSVLSTLPSLETLGDTGTSASVNSSVICVKKIE